MDDKKLKQLKISKNSKSYKEAAWFINRLIDFDTLSYKEIVDICRTAAILAENLDVTIEETVYKLEQTG